jgi:ketosteroid isomerase-like protein
MSERADNERVVSEAFLAYNSREIDRLQDMLAADAEAHIAQPLVNAGTWRGRAGFREMVDSWTEAFESQTNTVVGMEHPDAHNVIADVHQVGVGAGSGVPVEMRIAYLFEIRGGKVTRLGLYPDVATARGSVRRIDE